MHDLLDYATIDQAAFLIMRILEGSVMNEIQERVHADPSTS